ncbi:MAG: YceD family protein [Gammaproteobacteria bacterium]
MVSLQEVGAENKISPFILTAVTGVVIIHPLMQSGLSGKIDLWKVAAAHDRLSGSLPLAELPRLSALLHSTDGCVAVQLAGGMDDQSIAFIAGQAKTTVEVVCQRCLEVMSMALAVDFRLGLVASETQAENLPARYEPLILQEPLSVAELVEDELLLALPLAPKHENSAQCRAGMRIESAAETSTSKPFAQLAGLLNNPKQKS